MDFVFECWVVNFFLLWEAAPPDTAAAPTMIWLVWFDSQVGSLVRPLYHCVKVIPGVEMMI